MVQTSLVRAALLVAFGALFDAVAGPYLTFGGVSPTLTMICVVVAASSLEELQGIVIGFFGGVLVDALGVAPGLFGAGALAGIIAGWLASRAGELQRKRASGALMAQVVAVVVAANDLIKLAAAGLAGLSGPPVGEFILWGVIPDAVLNALLAYIIGERLLSVIQTRRRIL